MGSACVPRVYLILECDDAFDYSANLVRAVTNATKQKCGADPSSFDWCAYAVNGDARLVFPRVPQWRVVEFVPFPLPEMLPCALCLWKSHRWMLPNTCVRQWNEIITHKISEIAIDETTNSGDQKISHDTGGSYNTATSGVSAED